MTFDMPKLNNGIQRIRRAIASHPVVDDVARIGVLTFSDSSKVVVPLCQMSAHDVPVLYAEGGTNYGAAFRLLAQTISRDIADLRSHRYEVYRPCAFFLTAGEPLDPDWDRTFRDTLTYNGANGTGMKSYPVFVPFGFRDAPEHVLRKLAYPPEKGRWYHSKSHDPGEALRGILSIVMNSVIRSGNELGFGGPTIILPPPTPRFGVRSDFPDDEWI
jgi:uncharacterized protein YegL